MWKVVYFENISGRRPVEEFINCQAIKERQKIFSYIELLKAEGYRLGRPFTAAVNGRVRELRVEFSPNNFRIFYYFTVGNTIVLLHGIKKKYDRLKRNDINTAIARMQDFETRIKDGEVRL